MGSLQRGMSTDSGLADLGLCGSLESSGALGFADSSSTTSVTSGFSKTTVRLSQRRSVLRSQVSSTLKAYLYPNTHLSTLG